MSIFKYMALQGCLGLFAFSSLFAEAPVKEEEHIAPGLRAMKHCEWVKIQEERSLEAKGEKEPSGESLTLKANFAKAVTPLISSPQSSVYYTTHPGAFYYPVVVSLLGDSVQLHDGSIWSIANGDSYKTLNWLTSDIIVITPNQEWFSSYMFRMTNQDTGVSVKCNMMLGPIYNGLYTHWIYAIDYVNKEILLRRRFMMARDLVGCIYF